MSEIKQKFIKKVIHSSWFMTLVSTMIGVIAGFYLTDFNEKRKLTIEKNVAMKMVAQELDDNHQNLKKLNDSLMTYYHPFKYVISKISEDYDEIIIPKDSLDIFINRSQKVFSYTDWEPNTDGNISVQGELEINFDSKFLVANMSNIVWDSYKQSKFLSITPFSCLVNLEPVYNFQEKVDKLNQEWFTLIYQLKNGNATMEDFLDHWEQTITMQGLLLDFYEGKERLLENCN